MVWIWNVPLSLVCWTLGSQLLALIWEVLEAFQLVGPRWKKSVSWTLCSESPVSCFFASCVPWSEQSPSPCSHCHASLFLPLPRINRARSWGVWGLQMLIKMKHSSSQVRYSVTATIAVSTVFSHGDHILSVWYPLVCPVASMLASLILSPQEDIDITELVLTSLHLSYWSNSFLTHLAHQQQCLGNNCPTTGKENCFYMGLRRPSVALWRNQAGVTLNLFPLHGEMG